MLPVLFPALFWNGYTKVASTAVQDRRVFHQYLLSFGGVDIETARDDQVLRAVDDKQVIVVV